MEKEQAGAAADEKEGSLEDALESMIEEAEVEGEAAAPSTEEQSAEHLVKQLEAVRAKADEHWDQLVRTKAQMDNLSKRHQRELENAHKYGLDKFVGELLSVWTAWNWAMRLRRMRTRTSASYWKEPN